MDLFAKQPEETLWVLTPINLNTGSFKKEGTPVEGQLFFDRSKSGRLRFNRFYNYLLKIEH